MKLVLKFFLVAAFNVGFASTAITPSIVKILYADGAMSPDRQAWAVSIIEDVMAVFDSRIKSTNQTGLLTAMSAYVRQRFDSAFDLYWACIIARNGGRDLGFKIWYDDPNYIVLLADGGYTFFVFKNACEPPDRTEPYYNTNGFDYNDNPRREFLRSSSKSSQ